MATEKWTTREYPVQRAAAASDPVDEPRRMIDALAKMGAPVKELRRWFDEIAGTPSGNAPPDDERARRRLRLGLDTPTNASIFRGRNVLTLGSMTREQAIEHRSRSRR